MAHDPDRIAALFHQENAAAYHRNEQSTPPHDREYRRFCQERRAVLAHRARVAMGLES